MTAFKDKIKFGVNFDAHDWDSRTRLLLGDSNIQKLKSSHILIAGAGGVGGYVCEFLARAGVGHLTIIDSDTVQTSNLNRQIIATCQTIGQQKTHALKNRLQEISPFVQVTEIAKFYHAPLADLIFDNQTYNVAIDAIDSLAPKVSFLQQCVNRKIPVFSSMGAGAKFAPEKILIADISKTHHCRLAAKLRRELKECGIEKGITTVFSQEPASTPPTSDATTKSTLNIGTISYLPAMFGGFLASLAIRHICEIKIN